LCTIDGNKVLEGSVCTEIRSLHLNENNSKLLVGTYGSEVYELVSNGGDITSSTEFKFNKKINNGHYTPNKKWTNEAWGLDVMPTG
jgi:microtubule-associated protein-like 6